MALITIIGRGHGGTRAISHTLMVSNVFMGEPLNRSGDLLPPQDMYAACRVLANHVQWQGGLQWDFSALHSMEIPGEFTQLIQRYLKTVLNSKDANRGWKIPETTLVFPWIVRLFPEIKYIYWVRNPRDNILARHLTDDLADFAIPYPNVDEFLQAHYPALIEAAKAADVAAMNTENPTAAIDELRLRVRRAISWQYQYEIVKATPKPQNWITVRFEDFVRNQNGTLARLEEYLGIPLARIIVRQETVGRYDNAAGVSYFDFLEEGMCAFGYEIPSP